MRPESREMPVRSALFVPGHQPERVKKALGSQADAVIIDLEDAVPPGHKQAALAVAAKEMAEAPRKPLLVRVNALDSGPLEQELNTLAAAGASCLMIPKVESAETLKQVGALLGRAEERAGAPTGAVRLIPLIESAAGIFNIAQIVQSPVAQKRVWTVAMGAADYATDAGVELGDSGEELLYPRSALAIACRAAGLAPPLDTPYMLHITDGDKVRADALRARRLGFQGKLCVHPKQLDPVNQVFSPTPEEVEHARRVLEAFAKGSAQGRAAIQLDGKFIDKPVVDKAQKTLDLAGLMQDESSGVHE